jgi:hypothetical protein
MKVKSKLLTLLFFCSFQLITISLHSQEAKPVQISINQQRYNLYPETLDRLPEIPSPFTTDDGIEILLALMRDNNHALIPVTVENGNPLVYSTRIEDLFGKDRQLHVDSGDFPTLARTGLHSESELDGKEMITGFPVSLVNYIGQPGKFSRAGFMADDEDIINILKGDNRFVQKLSLTHPDMAKPLFHVWNIILKEIELGKWARHWNNIQHIVYNERKVILQAEGGKGWQISIFQDEIKGRFDINVRRDLLLEEKSFLKARYSYLSARQMTKLEDKLSSIHFSEMAPYYIMRYGFYEGHTDWRSDPIAIVFVFGLKSLEEIENAFKGNLYEILTGHFSKKDIGK